MRGVRKTSLYIRIGKNILLRIEGCELPGNFNQLFRETARAEGITYKKDRGQYLAQYDLTKQYVLGRLAERKKERSHRHASHRHESRGEQQEREELKRLAQTVLRANGPHWRPSIEEGAD